MFLKFRKVVDRFTTFFLQNNQQKVSVSSLDGSKFHCVICVDNNLKVSTVNFSKQLPIDIEDENFGRPAMSNGLYTVLIPLIGLSENHVRFVEIRSCKPIGMKSKSVNKLQDYVMANIQYLESLKYE